MAAGDRSTRAEGRESGRNASRLETDLLLGPGNKNNNNNAKGIGGKTEMKIKLGKMHTHTKPTNTDGKAPQEKLRKCAPCRNGNGSRTGQLERDAVSAAGGLEGSLSSGDQGRNEGDDKSEDEGEGRARRAMTRPAPAVVSAKERKMTKSKGSAPHCAV